MTEARAKAIAQFRETLAAEEADERACEECQAVDGVCNMHKTIRHMIAFMPEECDRDLCANRDLAQRRP